MSLLLLFSTVTFPMTTFASSGMFVMEYWTWIHDPSATWFRFGVVRRTPVNVGILANIKKGKEGHHLKNDKQI